MTKWLKNTLIVHALAGLVVGAPLLLIPGRFLKWFGWQEMLSVHGWDNTDPYASRLLGAAFLALAWSSFRGWRAAKWEDVALLVEMEIVFTVLGCIGLGRHLFAFLPRTFDGTYPLSGWAAFFALLLFAIAWIISLIKNR